MTPLLIPSGGKTTQKRIFFIEQQPLGINQPPKQQRSRILPVGQ